jgi:hypothetical protein
MLKMWSKPYRVDGERERVRNVNQNVSQSAQIPKPLNGLDVKETRVLKKSILEGDG